MVIPPPTSLSGAAGDGGGAGSGPVLGRGTEYQVGALALPGDLDASAAFDAFHLARRRLAYHVGGEAASQWAAGALSDAASTG